MIATPRRTPRWLVMSTDELEREKGAGEHEFKKIERKKEGEGNLRSRRCTAMLLGSISSPAELWNGKIGVAGLRLGVATAEEERGAAWGIYRAGQGGCARAFNAWLHCGLRAFKSSAITRSEEGRQ